MHFIGGVLGFKYNASLTVLKAQNHQVQTGSFFMQILQGIYLDKVLVFALTEKLMKRTVFYGNLCLLPS